jgi:hypothetical protein
MREGGVCYDSMNDARRDIMVATAMNTMMMMMICCFRFLCVAYTGVEGLEHLDTYCH